ncbi:MAG: hypothetical protein UHX00_06410 [Caryophanon sp.]|nr:hypothetical protein [Caryophanon sp.]
METFEFVGNGGYIATLTDDELIIECKGVKSFWIFYHVKPRVKHIPIADIIRIDTKNPGIRPGYVRFMTPEIMEYQSSSYVAVHDPNSIMLEEEDMASFDRLFKLLKKKNKQITRENQKM